jgi:CO dehydrogenase maturation factor
MKLAITGKGGVGKTTLASLLVRICAAEGNTVLAIDANPDANLAAAVGIPAEEASRITPIAELHDLIEERTGAKPGSFGGQFKLNPRVDDIPERFAARKDHIRLLVLGTVKKGGDGCICPESAVLRSLMAHLLLRRSEVVILDMDAGLEHLGRATAQGVDAFIVVVEPGQRSIQTAQAIKRLAKDIGITKCYAVGSKTHDESERQFIKDNLPNFEVLGFINFDPQIAEADRRGQSVYDSAPQAAQEARQIKLRLDSLFSGKKKSS